MKSRTDKKQVSRRGFLGIATGAVGGAIALLLGIPLLGSFVSPLFARRKVESEWVDLGRISDIPIGQPVMVKWTVLKLDGWMSEPQEKTVWVYSTDGENFTVWNPRCTHLGCLTYFDDQKNTINSPCHAGVFALPDGKVIAGPPPRPLDALPAKIEGGKLFIIYKDFRLGISDKIELL